MAAARRLIAQGWPTEARATLEALTKAATKFDGAGIAKALLATLPAKP